MSTFVERLAAGSVGRTVRGAADIRPALTPEMVPEALRLPAERRAMTRPPPASRPEAPQRLPLTRQRTADPPAPATTEPKLQDGEPVEAEPEPRVQDAPELSQEKTIVPETAPPPTAVSPPHDSTPERPGEVATRAPPANPKNLGGTSGAPAPVETTPTMPVDAGIRPFYDPSGTEGPAAEEVSGPERGTSSKPQAAVEPMENFGRVSGEVVEASEKRLDIGTKEAVGPAPSIPVETEPSSLSRGQPRPEPTTPEVEVPTVEAERVSEESGAEGFGEVGSTRRAGFERVTQRSQDPVVTINIGRIEVRAVNPENPPTDSRGPSLSLQDYMKRRAEKGR